MEAGADLYDDFNPDWIVAVGGGSVMDAAKAIWILYENPDIEVDEINPLDSIVLREKARLICVPTTAGTGSEMTKVQTDEQGRFKIPLEPGEYILHPESPNVMPTAGEQTFTVEAGKFTQVNITYDSGIR